MNSVDSWGQANPGPKYVEFIESLAANYVKDVLNREARQVINVFEKTSDANSRLGKSIFKSIRTLILTVFLTTLKY